MIEDQCINNRCCFSFACYSQKCFTQIYRALYEEAMLVPLRGVGTWRPYNNRNICHCVSLLKRSVITLELTSSSARTVQLATTKAKLIF